MSDTRVRMRSEVRPSADIDLVGGDLEPPPTLQRHEQSAADRGERISISVEDWAVVHHVLDGQDPQPQQEPLLRRLVALHALDVDEGGYWPGKRYSDLRVVDPTDDFTDEPDRFSVAGQPFDLMVDAVVMWRTPDDDEKGHGHLIVFRGQLLDEAVARAALEHRPSGVYGLLTSRLGRLLVFSEGEAYEQPNLDVDVLPLRLHGVTELAGLAERFAAVAAELRELASDGWTLERVDLGRGEVVVGKSVATSVTMPEATASAARRG